MKYLTYYDTPENKTDNRYYAPAAVDKIDYLCKTLNQIGHPVELISASMTRNRKGCRGKRIPLSDRCTLKLFACVGTGILPKRIFRRLFFRTGLFLYLFFRIRTDETVLVYHSLGYSGMVCLLRKLKKFRLILEVEEIYADVSGRERDRKKEFKLFAAADAYLFPTELLNGKINSRKKPYVLIHGTYQAEPDRGCRYFADDKVHCVYAGTFDPRKGCLIAAASAKYLPEQYHIHILGFGSREQTDRMRALVDELSGTCKCRITYDGLLSGEDYIKFLQSCDIGLSTQNPDAAFNDTSFPSKILSYMANGLQVVSIRIPAVEDSAVGAYLHYYDRQTPEQIANAIQQVCPNNPYSGRNVVAALDREFIQNLERLF